MKAPIRWLSCVLILISFRVGACEYADDHRLSMKQIPALIQTLTSGQPVPPIRIRVGTYLQLGEQSRKLLEPHLQMFDANCDPVGFFEGELLGRAVIPFEEFYQVMAQAIHENRPDLARRLYAHSRAAPMSVQDIQELFGQMPYRGSHGLQVRERMQQVFPLYLRTLPLDKALADPLKDGRPADYAMFKLYQVFGGEPVLENGCGPYPLHESFYRTERITGMLGERDVLVVRREPFLHMMQAMGHTVIKVDTLDYRITNCN